MTVSTTEGAASGEEAGAVFAALSDPTRRAVVRMLTERPRTASEMAEDLPVSRQAIAKHLSMLAAAGLVASDRVGREVLYRLTPAPMIEAASWMAQAGGEWDRRLDALRRSLARGRAPST